MPVDNYWKVLVDTELNAVNTGSGGVGNDTAGQCTRAAVLIGDDLINRVGCVHFTLHI